MRRRGGRSAVVLLGAALAAVVVLGLWLARRAGDDTSAESRQTSKTAGESGAPLAPPTFAVEPLADGTELAAAAGGAGSAVAASTAANSDAAAPLRAVVVFADGTPAAGATVVAAAGDLVVDTHITGADGVAAFAITGGRVELHVGGATPRPVRFEIEPASGEQRLELPAGAFVGGTVLLDGQPPSEPIGLVLDWDEAPYFDMPVRVQLALATVNTFWRQQIGQHTTAGRFLFGGLPPDWSGGIAFPASFRLEDEGPYDAFRVERPETGLVIRLTLDGALTGQLLEPAAGSDSARPARSAEVRYELTFGDGSGRSGSFDADEQGRFRLPLHSHSDDPARGTLRFRAADGASRGARDFADVDPRVGRDFGDVLLERTKNAEFLVLDEEGQPLAGAVATSLDATHARSQPTEESGRGALPDLLPEATGIRVDALGYEPVELPLSDDLVARLLPAPSLELALVDADGAARGRLVVSLDCQDRLFDRDEGSGIDELQVELGATSFFESSVTTGPNVEQFEGKALARGRVLFTRLRAGVPFNVAVHDLYGSLLRPPEELRLGPREQRRLEWRIDAQPRTVIVKALTTAGAPVPGARVSLDQASPELGETDWDNFLTRQSAGENGEARFEHVYASSISVQAERKGFGTAWLVDQIVPADGSTLELRLGTGRTIEVDVVDADGGLHDVASVALDGTARPVTADHVGLGHYRFEDAPPGRLTLRADLRGRSYRVTHDSDTPRARIELPALGAVSVRWTVPLAPGSDDFVSIRSPGPDGWGTRAWIHEDNRASSGPISVSELFPGVYEVVLRQNLGGRGEDTPVSKVAHVTVKAGEVTEVVLSP